VLDKQTARRNLRLAVGLFVFAGFMFAAAFVVELIVIHAI
jgi:hypothetical protein